jgi:hypothetical protein
MSSTRSRVRAFGVLAAIAAFAAVGAACGGSSSTTTATPAPAATATKPADPTKGPAPTESEAEQAVAVSLVEWTISGVSGAALGPLDAGEIKFNVHNDGTTQHEFVIIKPMQIPRRCPVGGRRSTRTPLARARARLTTSTPAVRFKLLRR